MPRNRSAIHLILGENRPLARGPTGRIAIPNVVGAHETSERLGVNQPQVAYDWRRRHANLPEPIAQVRMAIM